MNLLSYKHDSLRVIVLGYIIRMPIGGLVWHYFQYILGLARLGYEVYYIEDSCFFAENDNSWFYDPTTSNQDSDVSKELPTYGFKFITDIFIKAGLESKWAYYHADSSQWYGPCADRIVGICATADIVLNISGANPLRLPLRRIPVRIYIDTDPVFSQILHLTTSIKRDLVLQHTAFFSFGENISSGQSTVPCDGIPWQSTRQPIVLDLWTNVPGSINSCFTTVMAWDSYKYQEYNGIRYGLKSDSFIPYINLPVQSNNKFEIAMFDPLAPPKKLKKIGWVLQSGKEIIQTPWAYQSYIQQSKAEFSVAKQGYVISNSGWFSERSAAYLASFRPAIVQDTGFTKWMETGAGVIPFKNLEEAIAAIEEVNSNYTFHSQSARALVGEYFDSYKVLSQLIERSIHSAKTVNYLREES